MTMDDVLRDCHVNGLDIIAFEGCHYKRGIEYGEWCVAFLNHGERFADPKYVERHNNTDEVFVLLAGEATLLIGEARQRVKMEQGKFYNVRKGTWHQIITTPGARCLIVENADTGLANSDRMEFA